MHGGHGEVPRGGGRGEERAEPLGEGAEVRAEERVRCVDGAVVRPEAAVRAGEPRPPRRPSERTAGAPLAPASRSFGR